jgi:hypothetical protein
VDDTDLCPRCGGAFHCGALDAAPCACTTVALHGVTLAELRQRFTGCLCIACLAELAARQHAQENAQEKAGPV